MEDPVRNRVDKVKDLKAEAGTYRVYAERFTELANRKNQLLRVEPSE